MTKIPWLMPAYRYPTFPGESKAGKAELKGLEEEVNMVQVHSQQMAHLHLLRKTSHDTLVEQACVSPTP